MRRKTNTTYSELINLYKKNSISEDEILKNLHEKPICVNIDILKVEYEQEHYHDYYELLYVKKGRIHYSINKIDYYLSPGDIILIPPKTNHKLVSFLDNESSRYILMCSKSFLNKYSSKQTNLFTIFNNATKKNQYLLTFNSSQKIELERDLELTCKMMLEETFGIDLLYIHRFIKTLINITYLSLQQNANENLTNSSNKIIHKIIDYINENISQKINLDDLAKDTALSISRISHIFKEETGISILKYINKKRLSLAKELIRQGETFINISIKCGFQDYTSFFRTFKKEFNITPGEYSKKTRIFD